MHFKKYEIKSNECWKKNNSINEKTANFIKITKNKKTKTKNKIKNNKVHNIYFNIYNKKSEKIPLTNKKTKKYECKFKKNAFTFLCKLLPNINFLVQLVNNKKIIK